MISPYIFTVGMNLYVLLGKPVYRRWFLDGSDPDVRLVGLYVSSLFNVGGEAGGGGRGVGRRRFGFLCLTPTFGFQKILYGNDFPS